MPKCHAQQGTEECSGELRIEETPGIAATKLGKLLTLKLTE